MSTGMPENARFLDLYLDESKLMAVPATRHI